MALAERWGIGDDGDRENAVANASEAERRELVDAVDGLPEDFWDWLVGPAASEVPLSREYVVLTTMTMAADSARLDVGSG